MAYNKYEKQSWADYDLTKPTRIQPDAVISKERLDHIEDGIAAGNRELVAGNLVVSETSTTPHVEFEYEAEQVKLNIEFPASARINDEVLSQSGTWSSAKIRQEIDEVASGTFYTCSLSCTSGLIFSTASDVKSIVATILRGKDDITGQCSYLDFKWQRSSNDKVADAEWNNKHYAGKTIEISMSDIGDCPNVTYICSYTGLTSEGATIDVSNTITFVNMVFEIDNTSITFELDPIYGTVFNNDDSPVSIEARVFKGTENVTNKATYRWYLNNVALTDQAQPILEMPVTNLPLENVFACEVRLSGMTYRKSINISNRKNVIISSTPTNDPYLGDIWYDTTVSMYKKWTERGWEVIEDPTKEVTGDVILSVQTYKTVQENSTGISELRQQIKTTGDTVESFMNQTTSSVDEFSQTLEHHKETLDGFTQEITSIKGIAGLLSLIVKEGENESSFELTPEFINFISKNVVIEGGNVDITGFTSINGAFKVDEQGYMHATKGGYIGPWRITDDELYLERLDLDYRMGMGVDGININDIIKIGLAGFDSPNFKIDPIDGSVTINADTLKLSGAPVATSNSKIGVRNLLLTSGSYQYGKPTYWKYEELPWALQPEPVLDQQDVTDTTETYMTFTKLGNEVEPDSFIKLPLTESLTVGQYVFNIKIFTTGEVLTKPFRIYLVTDDNRSKMIGEVSSIVNTPMELTFTYNHANIIPYSYIGIKCSEFDVGDSFSIVNMSLYRSEVIVKEWQPAPEDGTQDYKKLNDSVETLSRSVDMKISELGIETIISGIFQGDTWDEEKQTIISETLGGLDIGTITTRIDNLEGTDNSVTEGKVNELYEYIKLMDGDISLGNNQSPIKLTLSNDKIGFTNNGEDNGYFNGNRLFINEVEIIETIKIGAFRILKRSNGRLTLIKDE